MVVSVELKILESDNW